MTHNPNCTPPNIKLGVNIGGQVGTLKPIQVVSGSIPEGAPGTSREFNIPNMPFDPAIIIIVSENRWQVVIYSPTIKMWSYKGRSSSPGKVTSKSYSGTTLTLKFDGDLFNSASTYYAISDLS